MAFGYWDLELSSITSPSATHSWGDRCSARASGGTPMAISASSIEEIEQIEAGEQIGATICIDADNDGASVSRGCLPFDCDDNDAEKFIGNTEICGDGKDNNCANGIDESLCQDKACTELLDAGNNVTGFNLSLADAGEECIGPDVVKEFFCDSTGKNLQSAPKSCSMFVSANSFCNAGACKTCVNTDPPGINYTVAGSAYNLTFLNSPKQDYCINNTHLNESFCSGNNINFQVKKCSEVGPAYSCQQGACFCNPSYVKFSCANEIAVFKDASACGASDYTAPYDCDGNGVISKPSCISTTADVAIGSNFLPFNNSANYSGAGLQIVQVAEGYQGVEFDWNFSASEKLDFCNIEIKTSSPTDKFGYVLFNSSEGISNKIVYIDKQNASSKGVCIKDIPGVVSMSEFSVGCNATDEIKINCPGNFTIANPYYNYNCTIVDNGLGYQVWPLKHSAVKEMLSITGLVSLGGTGDFSNFTNQTGTGETEETGCNPQWTCTDFGKCADGFKSRICTDSNNCGDETTKPSETSECRKISPLIIALIVVGLILIIFLIWYFARKKDEEESSDETPASHHSPPRNPPSPPQNRTPQYAPRLAPQR